MILDAERRLLGLEVVPVANGITYIDSGPACRPSSSLRMSLHLVRVPSSCWWARSLSRRPSRCRSGPRHVRRRTGVGVMKEFGLIAGFSRVKVPVETRASVSSVHSSSDPVHRVDGVGLGHRGDFVDEVEIPLMGGGCLRLGGHPCFPLAHSRWSPPLREGAAGRRAYRRCVVELLWIARRPCRRLCEARDADTDVRCPGCAEGTPANWRRVLDSSTLCATRHTAFVPASGPLERRHLPQAVALSRSARTAARRARRRRVRRPAPGGPPAPGRVRRPRPRPGRRRRSASRESGANRRTVVHDVCHAGEMGPRLDQGARRRVPDGRPRLGAVRRAHPPLLVRCALVVGHHGQAREEGDVDAAGDVRLLRLDGQAGRGGCRCRVAAVARACGERRAGQQRERRTRRAPHAPDHGRDTGRCRGTSTDFGLARGVRYSRPRRPGRATGARSSTDRASDYGSEGLGFESLRARRRTPADLQVCRGPCRLWSRGFARLVIYSSFGAAGAPSVRSRRACISAAHACSRRGQLLAPKSPINDQDVDEDRPAHSR